MTDDCSENCTKHRTCEGYKQIMKERLVNVSFFAIQAFVLLYSLKLLAVWAAR